MKFRKILSLFLLLCLVFSFAGCSSTSTPSVPSVSDITSVPSLQIQPAPAETEKNPVSLGRLEIHFLNVGDADAILIVCNNEAMLIDGGEGKQGDGYTDVKQYLKDNNIFRLEYIVATHPHADHIKGLTNLLNNFGGYIRTIFSPVDKNECDKQFYKNFVDAAKKKKIPISKLRYGACKKISLSTANVSILAPRKNYPSTIKDWENNMSLFVKIDFGENSFLFTGDAEETSIKDWVSDNTCNLHADVLKISHHGSETAASSDFINKVFSENNRKYYAVFSCGPNNQYKHPSSASIDCLKKHTVEIFRTDYQGNIVFTSNGHDINFIVSNPNISKSSLWTPGPPQK